MVSFSLALNVSIYYKQSTSPPSRLISLALNVNIYYNQSTSSSFMFDRPLPICVALALQLIPHSEEDITTLTFHPNLSITFTEHKISLFLY